MQMTNLDVNFGLKSYVAPIDVTISTSLRYYDYTARNVDDVLFSWKSHRNVAEFGNIDEFVDEGASNTSYVWSANEVNMQSYYGQLSVGTVYGEVSMSGFGEYVYAGYVGEEVEINSLDSMFSAGWLEDEVGVNGWFNTVYTGNNDDATPPAI